MKRQWDDLILSSSLSGVVRHVRIRQFVKKGSGEAFRHDVRPVILAFDVLNLDVNLL